MTWRLAVAKTYNCKDKSEMFRVAEQKTTERMRRPSGVIALLVAAKLSATPNRKRAPRLDNMRAHAKRALGDFVTMHNYDPGLLDAWIDEQVAEAMLSLSAS